MPISKCPLAAVLTLALAGCGDANAVRDLALATGITGGEPKPAPDFVSRTRPAEPDYVPTGAAPPGRTRPKDKDRVADAETELNGIRSRNERRGAQARRAGATPPATAPKAPPPAPD